MGSTFVAYIDESGDEGFRTGAGSSNWFVLGAVVLRRQNELEQVNLIDTVRTRINLDRKPEQQIPDKKPLHFRDLKHEQRKYYTSLIGAADLRTAVALVHKPDLTSPETFMEKSRLYFYAVRLLVERLSWYCRDRRRKEDEGDGSLDLVFSNRAAMDYSALRDYLAYLEANRAALDYRAEPAIVQIDHIASHTHGRRMGLQIADAVASSYYYAVERSGYGFTEDAYARLLLPRAYRHEGRLWGYGVKVMPPGAEEKRRSGDFLVGWEP